MGDIRTFLADYRGARREQLIRRVSHKREIHQLKTEIQRYRKQYEEDSKALKEITSNKEALEKVAREKYLMKKENEDIFIFEEDK